VLQGRSAVCHSGSTSHRSATQESNSIRERLEDPPWSARTASVTDWPELAHRELVNRIVTSPTFARTERLSTLLTYVCDMALKGRDGDLNEQNIGHAVFNRSPDYDSSIDGIVRTQASRLRQRLDQYYDQDGAEEPVRVVIPKGGYVPVFVPRHSTEEPRNPDPQLQALDSSPIPALPLDSLPAPSPSKGWMLPWALSILLFGALATLSWFAIARKPSPSLPVCRRIRSGVRSSRRSIPHLKSLATQGWCCLTSSTDEAFHLTNIW
jgi:hypothetical protein